MPDTAYQHFQEDIERAEAILSHASQLPRTNDQEVLLSDDLLRSCWMFSVGAMDAYFCDAYTDLLASVLMSKERQQDINLPAFLRALTVPLDAVYASYVHRRNWRWRMMARRLMARENVLSLDTIKSLFNPFFRKQHKFFADQIDPWIKLPGATARIFGTTRAKYNAAYALAQAEADEKERDKKRKSLNDSCVGSFGRRYKGIFQRRHDCIHNCDRPSVAITPLHGPGTVRNTLNDVKFLVTRCNAHINVEFRVFLQGLGCTAITINQVGY